MDPGRTPARGASIRLIPPDEQDPFVEPSKSQFGISSSSNVFAPDAGLVASREGHQAFRFGFASPAAQSPPSPAVGESALSPPEPSKSRFSASTILSPEQTRTSSFAIPWHPPVEPSASRFSKDTSSPELPRLSLPNNPQASRFSSTTSSPSESPPASSPPPQSFFSPTIDEDYSPQTPHYSLPSRSHFSATTVDSPPPLPPRADQPSSPPPQGPPTPSQWQAFFSPQLQYQSHFSASTTSPPEASPPSPPSTTASTSSSNSMDGTLPSALPEIPPNTLYNQPNRRIYSSASSRYSHPFPTTDLSVIDEDEVYASSPPLPPAVPRRNSSRPMTADRETQTSDSLEYGAAAAVAYAAGALPPPEPASLPPLPPIPQSAAAASTGQRVSFPPQLPPLPPFNHSTSSLQRYFSYFPTPDPNASPVIGTDGQPRSPCPSILTFGSVTGPNGERFSALREKRKSRGVYWADGTPKKRWCGVRGMTRKLWLAVLVIAFVAMVVLAIGLGVGLSQNNGDNDDQGQADGNGANNAGGNGGGAGNGTVDNGDPVLPAGVFSITTNLLNISTACTNISETWSCAPGQTFQQGGVNASQVGLVWTVSQNNLTEESNGDEDDGFSISSVDNPFSLQFNNTPLTLREQGTENEHWGFEVRVKKRVKPRGDITGNNVAVECDYSQAQLGGRLFTRRQPDPVFADGEGSWPGAVEVDESSEIEGECFEIRNGVRGDRVNVGVGPGECVCSYGDSDPG